VVYVAKPRDRKAQSKEESKDAKLDAENEARQKQLLIQERDSESTPPELFHEICHALKLHHYDLQDRFVYCKEWSDKTHADNLKGHYARWNFSNVPFSSP
jgi:hypothetical protein